MRLARSMGAARVIAVQRSRGRLEAARRIGGADVVICSLDERPGGGGAGCDRRRGRRRGHHGQRHRWRRTALAFEIVRNRATINLFGGLPADAPPLALASNAIHYKELTVTGSHGSVDRHHRVALDLLAARRIDPDPYLTHHFALDDILQAIDTAAGHDGMKAIVYPHGVPEV